MTPLEISVVVPVYCSAPTLPVLVDRLLATLNGMGVPFEIIFVEDGSPDDAWRVLTGLQQRHPDRLVVVQLMRNYGQHNALMCGFHRARGRFVVTLDDDLQNPPEEIPKLYRAIVEQGLDLVYGQPRDKRHAGWRNAGSWLINSFFRRVFNSSVSVTAFRIIRWELVQCTFAYDLNFTFVDGLLAWNTQRLGAVEVEHHDRAVGRSSYSVGKLVRLALNLFTNFSLLPLRVISVCGLSIGAMGFVAAFYYLVLWFTASITVPGYASLIVAVLVLGGVQLLALGVMGEYLGRLHLNVNRKPQFVERQALGSAPDQGRDPRAA
jgi:undecaprenyl-phosphate 4-deoxy-4-formamido-L-arabinose transferase